MKPIITFLCAVLLTIASQASGQNMSTSFSAVPGPGQPPYLVGSQVKINMNVTNFTNVSSVLMPVTYNSAVLRFDSIDLPVIPEYGDTSLIFHPNPGVVKITWFPSLLNYPDGVTVPGTNTRLLTLCFTVVGNGVTSVNLSTSVPFTPIEVINASGNLIFSNPIFNSSGSSGNGVSITGGTGNPPPPPLVGFKIVGNDVYAKQGNRVCVPITVNDFDNIQLLQYAMHWDNTKLTYDCVRGATNPLIPTFNAPVAAPGTLLMLWEDPNLLSGTGVTKADGTRIYEVCFNTIGAPGTETNITFDGLGFGIPPNFSNDQAEATNAAGNAVWTTGGPNGPSGVSSKVFIMAEPPGGSPLTFTADMDNVAPTATTCVDVKVKNFSAITESEFMMTYDASKLTYVPPVTIPVTSLNLLPANFTHNVNGNNGTVKFKWSLAAGATVPDNTVIFSLCFTATGASGSVVPINFATSACPNPTPFAAFKKDVGGVPYKFENGQVSIMTQGPTLQAVPTLCNTGATGSINVTPNGTATGFVWAGPGINAGNMTVEDPTGLTAGIYTVTVTYSGGSTATSSATVTSPAAVSMTQTAVGVTCFGLSDGSVDITPAGGTAPYTYSWAGPTAFTATTQDITGVKTGNYVVTITDANQCTFVSPAVNVSSPTAISVPNNNIVITTVKCFGGSDGGIAITPTGGTAPYTYDWSNDGPENPDNDPQNIVGLIAGTFTVTITDNKGCSFTPTGFMVTAPAQMLPAFVKKEDVKCFNSPTGKAEITVTGGSGNKTYCWKLVSGGACVSTDQNPTNLMPGTYNVTVTDGNGCTAFLPSNVVINNAPAEITVSNSTTPSQCFSVGGTGNGTIDMTINGGWGNYTCNWPDPLPDQHDLTGVSSGSYTVTITDGGGCTASQTVVVPGPQNAIGIGTPVISNVSCAGQGNGGICLSLSGGNGAPYQVSWSNTPLTGACIGALAGGSYAPTVSDAMGCTAVFSTVQVTEPQQITLTSTISLANPTGGVDLSVSGGTPNGGSAAYNYSWSGPSGYSASTEDITGVVAGLYTVVVTDANGCSKTSEYTIPSANVLNFPSVSSVINSCNNDGCINITLPSGASAGAPFVLSWAGGNMPPTSSLTPSACGLAAGTYIVTITASNGNTATVSATVNQSQQALLNFSTINNPFDDLQNGSITIAPTFPNTTVLWNTGSTALTLTNLDQGNYSVTVTNNTSGCTAVYNYPLVRQFFPYVVGLEQPLDHPSCANSQDGSIKIKVEGGDGPNYVYSWTGPNGFTATTQDLANVAPGTYSVTITQENGNTNVHGPYVLVAQSNLAITNVNELSTTPGGTQVSGINICDGEASVVFSGQIGATSVLWSNGVTTADNLSLCGGAYSVSVTDALGCVSIWHDALTVPTAIAATDQSVSPKCGDEPTGSAKVFVSGGIQPYDVVWSNGQFDTNVFANSFSEATSLDAGDYTVTITDGNGVTQVHNVTVPGPLPLSVTYTGIDAASFNSCDGERIAFVANAVEPISYEWIGKVASSLEQRVENVCAGEILYLTIQDANGCILRDTIEIPFPEDGCYLVRPVLTPAEQDGNNDYTSINCIEEVSNNVEIFNRWGQLVFQTDNYVNDPTKPSQCWTGVTRTNQPLPEGVYYYVLTIVNDEGVQQQFKGHINLLK